MTFRKYNFSMTKKILLLSAVLLLTACRVVPFTGRKQLSLVKESAVLALSLQEYNTFMSTAKVSTDATSRALVDKVGRRLSQAVTEYYRANGMASELKNFSWEFNLVNNSAVNAFCMPGGKIVVYTGILPYTKDEDGLAVVLGHEIAHALAKHAAERMSQQIPVYIGAVGLDLGLAIANKSNETRQLAQNVFGLGATAGMILPFSRKHELEADRIGLIIMAMAGYNPSHAPEFWQRMASSKKTATIEFLSTHPSDSRRIAEIKKYLPEAMNYYKK